MSTGKKRYVDQNSAGAYNAPSSNSDAASKRFKPTTICDADGHIVMKLGENLTARYKVIDRLGEGTFGKVLCCWDREKREYVAIKAIRNVKKYRDAAKIEIEVLERLRRVDVDRKHCLVRMRSWFDYYGHYCLVFKQYGLSVFDFMKKNHYRPFSADVVQDVARQLLEATAFMHEITLIHTDLKPENLLFVDSAYEELPLELGSKLKRGELIPRSNAIKVIDLGSATYQDGHHTTVVSTRHYRAPEVILNIGWSYPCDLWSIGCIIVELYIGEALFQTHHDLEHLAIMQQVLGKLPSSMTRRADPSLSSYFFKDHSLRWPDKAESFESERYVSTCKPLKEVIRAEDSELLNLLQAMLQFDPSQRITAREALRHPYFNVNYSHTSKLTPPVPTVDEAAAVSVGAEDAAVTTTTTTATATAQPSSDPAEFKAPPEAAATATHAAPVDAVVDGTPIATMPVLSEPATPGRLVEA